MGNWGFRWKTPKHSLGLRISVYLLNIGIIFIIRIILWYWVIISIRFAHPEQFSSVSCSWGHEQLNRWTNSLACLEGSEPLHAPVILSDTGRPSSRQNLIVIRQLLHQKRHIQLKRGFYCWAVTPEEGSTSSSSVQLFMHAYYLWSIISRVISGKC